MKKTLAAIVAALVPAAAPAIPYFPSADGYGAENFGGSGRHLTPVSTTVMRVTTLADAGPGSLRACVEATGPRMCVFEISGRIVLQSRLRAANPYITIAGQTAPYPGIWLTCHRVNMAAAHAVIQHIVSAPGDCVPKTQADQSDGFTIGNDSPPSAANPPTGPLLLDHVGAYWANDGGIDINTYGSLSKDITVSNSLVAETLSNGIASEMKHSTCGLMGPGVKNVSYSRNICASNRDRNLKIRPGMEMEATNNYFYNWNDTKDSLGGFGTSQTNLMHTNEDAGGAIKMNIVGNVWAAGPNSATVAHAALNATKLPAGSKYYVANNIGPSRLTDTGSEWLIATGPTGVGIMAEATFRSLTPLIAVKTSAMPVAQVKDTLVRDSGPRPWNRDPVTARIIGEVAAGTGAVRDCVGLCDPTDRQVPGGWPVLPENRRPLTLPDDPNGDCDGDGYTNLEEWVRSFEQ